MPDEGLERFGVGRDVGRIYSWDDDAGVCNLSRISAVTADNAANRCASFLRVFERADEIGADVFLGVAAADGEDEDHVGFVEVRSTEPVGVASFPAFVVDASSEFGNVVGRRIGFDLGDLAEVADSVRGMASTATNAEKKETTGTLAQVGKEFGGLFDGRLVELAEDVDGFPEIFGSERHF